MYIFVLTPHYSADAVISLLRQTELKKCLLPNADLCEQTIIVTDRSKLHRIAPLNTSLNFTLNTNVS